MVHKLSKYTYFASSVILDFEEAHYGNELVYDHYDEVISVISERAGAEAACLFARPEVTRTNGESLTSVAWYTTRSGGATKWRDVDPESQSRASALIGSLLERLRPLFDEPVIGPFLERWLNLPDLAGSLYLIGNKPVFISWGLLPVSATSSLAERKALLDAGFGRFADWLDIPPFHSDEGRRAAAPHPTEQPALATPVYATSGQSAATAVLAAAPATVCRRSWLPVLLAVILAACVLAVLLIPGVLVFPRSTVAYAIDVGQAEASLRQRITDLQAAIDNGTCGASGGTTQGSSPGGSAPPRAPALVTPAPAVPAPDESKAAPTAIPPEPRQVALSTADGAEATTLVDTLDSAAVLVVGYFGNSVATGSGFFINETDIVTNRHVVEEADTDKLVVVNKALGRPVPVSIVAMTPNSDITSPDFALLRLAAHDKTHGVLTLASAAQRAQNVLAYGYPAFVMESDTQYRCLLEGGEGCIPVGSTSQGFVTALQEGNGGLGLIVHSAALSGGNSGGPLVDYCGRVIGVNTFIKKTSAGTESLNFAQRAPALAAFLRSVYTEVPLDDGGCRLIPKPPADTAAAVPGN